MWTRTEIRFQRHPFKNCYYGSVFPWKYYNSLIRLSFVFSVIASASASKGSPFHFAILFLAVAIG